MVKKILLCGVRFYQKAVSPFLRPGCRFVPSCSEYCCAAIEKKGALRGLWLTALRLCKCHPFHPGGVDEIE